MRQHQDFARPASSISSTWSHRYRAPMNAALLSLVCCAGTSVCFGSELTTVDEPETTHSSQRPIVSTLKTKRRIYSRNGVKVAALVTEISEVLNHPPETKKYIQFLIDKDNWVEVDLDNPRCFISHGITETTIQSSNDSVTVTATKQAYFEIFFKSTGTFLNGANRDSLAHDYLTIHLTPR